MALISLQRCTEGMEKLYTEQLQCCKDAAHKKLTILLERPSEFATMPWKDSSLQI